MKACPRWVRTTCLSSCAVRRCPICGGAGRIVHEIYDDRYGYAGVFRLMRCTACGHGHLEGVDLTDAEVQALYSTYYPRRRMRPEDYCADVERTGFTAWLDGFRSSAFRWVSRDVKVLDIGCGSCQALGYHASRGCEVWGVESDENVRAVADRQGFNVRIGVFRPEDYPQDYFDTVTMDQVIEHMRDPVSVLSGVRRVLKPEGYVILSTPNAAGWGAKVFGSRWINWHAPYHLHFFTQRSMQLAADRAGLRAERLGTVTSSEWLSYQWMHLATFPKCGRQSSFWTGADSKNAVGRVAAKIISLLHRSKVNHVLTRLFDAMGIGDSQLFRLRRI